MMFYLCLLNEFLDFLLQTHLINSSTFLQVFDTTALYILHYS